MRKLLLMNHLSIMSIFMLINVLCISSGCSNQKGAENKQKDAEEIVSKNNTKEWKQADHEYFTLHYPNEFRIVSSKDKHFAITNLQEGEKIKPYINILIFGLPKSPVSNFVTVEEFKEITASGNNKRINELCEKNAHVMKELGTNVLGKSHKKIGNYYWLIFDTISKMGFNTIEYHAFLDGKKFEEVIVRYFSNRKESLDQYKTIVEQIIKTIEVKEK